MVATVLRKVWEFLDLGVMQLGLELGKRFAPPATSAIG
jgi:hypothetical protein